MKLKIMVLICSLITMALGIYTPVFSDLLAIKSPANLELFAPPIVNNNQKFITAVDVTACINKAPSVTWSAPGCAVSGKGSAVTLQCLGSIGSSIKVTATAGGGRPAACNGSGSTSVVIGGANDSSSIPKCGSAATVPIYYGKAISKIGAVKFQITECVENLPSQCPVIANMPNAQDLKNRAALALASAPAEIKWIANMAQSANIDSSFGALASFVRCSSPSDHPAKPGEVKAPEIRSWLKDTILSDGAMSELQPAVNSLSDSSLIYIYRRLVEARRGLTFGSLG